MRQKTIAFDKERGEEFSDVYANEIITEAFRKFNSLVDQNIRAITTGNIKTSLDLLFPNYYGMMKYEDIAGSILINTTRHSVSDSAFDTLLDNADYTLGRLI